MKENILMSLLFIGLIFAGCRKDKKTENTGIQPTNGTMNISFSAKAYNAPYSLGQKFVSSFGDTITITTFEYFISNIVLTKDDYSTYTPSECYNVINHADTGKKTITLNNVPPGNYKSIKFMFGVDSARNRSGAQTGGLDPAGEAAGMFWTWNSGYIMIKVEGTSPQSGDANKSIFYHMGGYGGPNKMQREFNLSFGVHTALVNQGTSPKIYLNTRIDELFNNPVSISVAAYFYEVGVGPTEKMFADNYADMITFDHIQNQ